MNTVAKVVGLLAVSYVAALGSIKWARAREEQQQVRFVQTSFFLFFSFFFFKCILVICVHIAPPMLKHKIWGLS
jgi:hypothetical protein